MMCRNSVAPFTFVLSEIRETSKQYNFQVGNTIGSSKFTTVKVINRSVNITSIKSRNNKLAMILCWIFAKHNVYMHVPFISVDYTAQQLRYTGRACTRC